MKTTREIYFVRMVNLAKCIFFEGEMTGDMLRFAKSKEDEFQVFDSKFLRKESLVHGQLQID
jgi:hypothetical protein